jgi:lipopolysaccharide exporter
MSKFISNIIKLTSATLAGQILGIIVTPILTRLYLPADFGLSQLFFSLVGLIAVISCLSYEAAIQLPKDDDDAANIVVLCIGLIMLISILSTILFFLFSSYIGQELNVPALSNYVFLLPLAIICNSFAFVLNYWLSRRQEFSTIAKANFLSSVSGKAVSLGSGIISPSPFGLIFGTIVNDGTIALILLRKTFREIHFFQRLSFQRIKQMAIRYKKFPQYNAIANLAATASVQSTPFLLAFFFSPVIVGYYAIAYTVLRLPSKLIGSAIANVFFQKASLEKNFTGSISHIAKAVHSRLISIGMFSCLIIIIIGPELFTFALGAQWTTAGVYAQILAPWFFVAFISTPLSSIFNVLEMQGVNFWFNILLLISRVVVILIAGVFGNPIIGLILLSFTGVIFWSWMNMYTLKIAGVPIRDEFLEIIRFLSFGLFVCFPLIVAKFFNISTPVLIIITIVISVLYYATIISWDKQLKDGVVTSLKNIIQK